MADAIGSEDTVVDGLGVVEIDDGVLANTAADDLGGLDCGGIDLHTNELIAVGNSRCAVAFAKILLHGASADSFAGGGGSTVDGDGDGLIVVVDNHAALVKVVFLLVNESPLVAAFTKDLGGGGKTC